MRTLARSVLALSLVALATAAHAGPGVNLRWNACLGDAGAVNRNFACDTNTGSEAFTASFELGRDLLQVSGLTMVIDLASAGTALPAWWELFQTGTCRQTAIRMNTTISSAAVNCFDWADAQAAGGIGNYNIGKRGANTTRFGIAIAVPQAALADLVAGREYFSVNLLIDHTKTVGTGACGGCTTPVCIVFNSIFVLTPAFTNSVTISGPTNGTDSNFVTWQGGAGVVVQPGPWGAGGSGCPAATATRTTTWGAVKSLYR